MNAYEMIGRTFCDLHGLDTQFSDSFSESDAAEVVTQHDLRALFRKEPAIQRYNNGGLASNMTPFALSPEAMGTDAIVAGYFFHVKKDGPEWQEITTQRDGKANRFYVGSLAKMTPAQTNIAEVIRHAGPGGVPTQKASEILASFDLSAFEGSTTHKKTAQVEQGKPVWVSFGDGVKFPNAAADNIVSA